MLAAASARPWRPAAVPRPRLALAAGGGRLRWLHNPRLSVTAASPQQQQPDERHGSGGSSSKQADATKQRKRLGSEKEPQPQLQAWLQQEQGLQAADADQHARRLALVFGSQQAALDSLPATFEWCRSRGLSCKQTAQLLDRIAYTQCDNVVQFAALVQPVWQLLDGYIAAYVEPLRQAGTRLPKHTSLAEVLRSSDTAALALSMQAGHVQAWLGAVSEQLPAAGLGQLLLILPTVVCASPATAAAAISWAADVLGVTELAAFLTRAPGLLVRDAATLQRNLDSLQQALGLTAEAARQLVVKQPRILTSSPDTVQEAAAWLRRLFADAEQLADVINRGAVLLTKSVQRLQANADTLQQALGWQDGDSQLAAFVAAHPQPFATVSLSSEDAQHKLRLLSEVVGVSAEACLATGSGYMKTGLETMAAHYMLALERAPELLFDSDGKVHLSWIITVSQTRHRGRLGLSDRQYHAFVREWKDSEEGRRLLQELRAGNMAGWPRPPAPAQAEQQQRAQAEQRRQDKAGQRTGTEAAIDGRRQGRGGGSQVARKAAANDSRDSTAAKQVGSDGAGHAD